MDNRWSIDGVSLEGQGRNEKDRECHSPNYTSRGATSKKIQEHVEKETNKR